jgi:hypothetical protein
VSDLAVSWVALAPSAWQRWLRRGALALSSAVIILLLVVHGADAPRVVAAAAAGLLFLAAVAWFVSRAKRGAGQRDAAEWRIDGDGHVSIRAAGQDGRAASVIFASPIVVVLRAGRRNVEIWRDAAPAVAFRRLSVAARWSLPRTGGAKLTAVKDAHVSERT